MASGRCAAISKRMRTLYNFPFGEPLERVVQQDRTPKRIFVLGVYASAVHARWVDRQSKTQIAALAVASEPYIFWRGDQVESFVSRISIPQALGRLVPASPRLNGPSGIALDELFLQPLGVERAEAWLCDLVPHSCLNPKQKAAIERAYVPITAEYHLPTVTIPSVPTRLADDQRRAEIADELAESQAEIILLLGDQPIRWFLRWFDGSKKKLSDFGVSDGKYGILHEVKIDDSFYQVLPLAHPRQAAGLGAHSANWLSRHKNWIVTVAPTLI